MGTKTRKNRINARNERREQLRNEQEERERVTPEELRRRQQKWFEDLEKESVLVQGIKTNVKYWCAHHKSWCMPRYVSETENFVVFYSNPGWIGNWYWMTTIENFKEHFSREPVGDVGAHVTGIKYVDVRLGFAHPRVATNKTWK